MNVFAKSDEIPSMILQDIKETKCYGHTDVKTVYPPTNTVCGVCGGGITSSPKGKDCSPENKHF